MYEWDTEIRGLFFFIDHALHAPPGLRNTDGDPLELHRLMYDLSSATEAFEKLCDLCVTMPMKQSGEQEALMRHPEVREKLMEIMSRHWETWIEEEMPALGGRTPREAVLSPEGREAVEALLRDAEGGGRGNPPGRRCDIRLFLRRRGARNGVRRFAQSRDTR